MHRQVFVEIMRQQVEELSQGIQCDRQASDNLRGLVVDLQDKLDSVSPQIEQNWKLVYYQVVS